MFIRSERLFLRPGWSEDWDELFLRINTWAVLRHLAVTAETARALVANVSDQRCPQFLITLPSGDGSRLIGCVGLVGGQHGAELVYWIAPEYSGLGYATEAGRAVLSLACTLGHRRIAAIHFADNTASDRVLRKLDFQATGETCRRLCPTRGVIAVSLVHHCDLGEPSACNGSSSDGARFAA